MNRHAEAVQRVQRKKRQRVFEYKSERGCEDCGEMDPVVLELDHIDPSSKIRNQVSMGLKRLNWSNFSFENLEKELAKCRVLCANCHRRRTVAQRGWYSRYTT